MMKVLIYTSSGGTAHDSAAEAIRHWLERERPNIEVRVDQVLERSSSTYRGGVELYNWIQRRRPWLHQIYWRAMELEDLVAGLRPELEATSSNSRNMSRIQKALGARFSEALRKLEELTGSSSLFPAIPDPLNSLERSQADNFTETLEQKLEALKKDLLN